VYLRHCLPGRIRRALDELPETLDATYERTLEDIHETCWIYAYRIFQCITVASRPLHVEELAEFLAFDFEVGEIPKLVEDWRTEDPEQTLLSTCASLIAVVNVDDSHIVQFSHFSVKEFLMSGRLATRTQTLSRYHIRMTPAHTIVGQACLGALVHLDEEVSVDSLKKFPLAKYATDYWVDHTQFENVSLDTTILFDPRKPHFLVWTRIYEEMHWFRGSQGTPLECAARFGLGDVAEFLVVEHLQDVNSRRTFDNMTPLHLASQNGHVEVVQVLLECGADSSAQNKDGSTPLHWASLSGHVEVVQVLLECGADSSAQNKDGSTPLHWASQSGNVELVQVLLDRGADPSAKHNDGWTPLHLASQFGHVEVVQVLLERGANPSAQNNNGWTPLHGASQLGHVEVVQVLLECGADVNVQSIDSWTPFRLASYQGHSYLARVLLAHETRQENHVSAAAED
jgi:ankyrin repeat protein